MSRAEYHREWCRRNPEKAKARRMRYYHKHRKELIAKVVKWRKQNPLKAWKNSRQYLMRNRRKIIMRKRKWYEKNKYRLKVKRVLGV